MLADSEAKWLSRVCLWSSECEAHHSHNVKLIHDGPLDGGALDAAGSMSAKVRSVEGVRCRAVAKSAAKNFSSCKLESRALQVLHIETHNLLASSWMPNWPHKIKSAKIRWLNQAYSIRRPTKSLFCLMYFLPNSVTTLRLYCIEHCGWSCKHILGSIE